MPGAGLPATPGRKPPPPYIPGLKPPGRNPPALKPPIEGWNPPALKPPIEGWNPPPPKPPRKPPPPNPPTCPPPPPRPAASARVGPARRIESGIAQVRVAFRGFMVQGLAFRAAGQGAR